MTDWDQIAKEFDVDFDLLASTHPQILEVGIGVTDLKEIQRLNKEFYDLGYKSKLSSVTIDSLDKEAQQYRQLVHDIIEIFSQPEQLSVNVERLKNEVIVRKREVLFFASQYLPYLQGESEERAGVYVDEATINAFEKRSDGFNYSKLIDLLRELNDNFSRTNPYSSAMTLRAVLDHTPPLLGMRTFEEVISNHSWTQTDRKYLRQLNDAKARFDDALHRVISKNESSIDILDIPDKKNLSILLNECLAADSAILEKRKLKGNKSKEAQNENSSAPNATLSEPYLSWAANYAGHGASFLAVINIDNYGGGSNYITQAKVIGTDANGTPFITDRFTFEKQQPNQPYPISSDEMTSVRIFISLDHTNRRPMPDLDRDTVKLELEFRSGKKISLPAKILQS